MAPATSRPSAHPPLSRARHEGLGVTTATTAALALALLKGSRATRGGPQRAAPLFCDCLLSH